MLENKVIVVTGANGGMGQAIVKKLLDKNAVVVGLDIAENGMKEIENERFTYEVIDMLNEDDVNKFFLNVFDKFSKIDGLVNAVGIAQKTTPIEEISLSEWNKINGVNSTSVFLTCREASRYMKKNNEGSIVNIVSVNAVRPRPGMQAYAASKGAAEVFTKALALELAPFGIRSNVLHPGPTDTSMLGKFTADGVSEESAKEEIFKKSVPLGTLIAPDDIAEGVLYLVSDGAKRVTGISLHVDGGRGI